MTNQTGKINWLHLIIFVVVVELTGSLSALFAGNIKQIYNGLSLPILAPPDFIFGIIWPMLYALIGISGYFIFLNSKSTTKLLNYSLFILQLVVNFGWSIIFFGGNAYWTGFIVILILDLLVIATISAFFKTSRLAAWLLIPYLVWLLFATYLSLWVAILN